MGSAIRTRDVEGKVLMRERMSALKKRKAAKSDAISSLRGKAFDSLTQAEKDDVLKALAIAAGIIEE